MECFKLKNVHRYFLKKYIVYTILFLNLKTSISYFQSETTQKPKINFEHKYLNKKKVL